MCSPGLGSHFREHIFSLLFSGKITQFLPTTQCFVRTAGDNAEIMWTQCTWKTVKKHHHQYYQVRSCYIRQSIGWELPSLVSLVLFVLPSRNPCPLQFLAESLFINRLAGLISPLLIWLSANNTSWVSHPFVCTSCFPQVDCKLLEPATIPCTLQEFPVGHHIIRTF